MVPLSPIASHAAAARSQIDWCPHAPWGVGDCAGGEVAGVCCAGEQGVVPAERSPGPAFTCAGGANGATSGSTRLVDCTAAGCRLEVRHDDQWGTVCGDTAAGGSTGFSDTAARVVCRSLGLPGGFALQRFGGRYGRPGYFRTWLSGVRCSGEEGWVGSCGHRRWGNVAACEHGDDVGVCCSEAPQFATVREMRDAGVQPPPCPPR